MTRLEEVMQRIGSRPALIRMENVSDHFGDAAPYRIEDGIAIIDVFGVLSNDPWSWGGTTYPEIQNQLKIAAQDPNVKGILLNINSPGGETDNSFETAELIASMKKPCHAVADTMAYSAGYLLASQADKIYCSPISGGVGSIGVYAAHMDYSELLKKAGISVTLISAGKGKMDGNPYEPLSEDARKKIQAEVNRLYGEFLGFVSRGRGIQPQDIVKFGADTFDGAANAIGSGLADAAGDLSTAWVDLCTEIQRPTMPMMSAQTSSVASATNIPKEGNIMAEDVKAEVTKTAAAEIETLLQKAKTDGYAEAEVIVDLCAIAGISVKQTAEFIRNKKTSADVRKELLAEKAKSQEGTELNTSVMPGVDAAASADQPKKPSKSMSDVVKEIAGMMRGK